MRITDCQLCPIIFDPPTDFDPTEDD